MKTSIIASLILNLLVLVIAFVILIKGGYVLYLLTEKDLYLIPIGVNMEFVNFG